MEHTTLLYIIYSSHILIFQFKMCTCQTCTHTYLSILYIVFMLFCTLPICVFVYYYFIMCVLSCFCHSVALWSFCRHNNFILCVNIPGQESSFSFLFSGWGQIFVTTLYGFLKIVKCVLSIQQKSQFTKAVWLSNYLSYYTTKLILHTTTNYTTLEHECTYI